MKSRVRAHTTVLGGNVNCMKQQSVHKSTTLFSGFVHLDLDLSCCTQPSVFHVSSDKQYFFENVIHDSLLVISVAINYNNVIFSRNFQFPFVFLFVLSLNMVHIIQNILFQVVLLFKWIGIFFRCFVVSFFWTNTCIVWEVDIVLICRGTRTHLHIQLKWAIWPL